VTIAQKVFHLLTFKKSDCQSCPAISNCTKSKSGFRTLTLRPQKFQETLEKARERQETKEFKQQFGIRSGVEGTISQGTRAFGLRRCRYLGFAKTRLQHILTARCP
jgi:transposase